MPDKLSNSKSTREYSIAATEYIIELREQLEICDSRVAGIRIWADAMQGKYGND